MKYVALLRGINVGGKSRVEMSRLKELFGKLGCENVITYINSGNVIFEDARTSKEVETLLAGKLAQEFGFAIPLIVVTEATIRAICNKIPSTWTNDTEQRTDVIFLWDEINNEDIKQKVPYKPEIERMLFLDGAVVWNIDRKYVTKGSVIKIINSDIYKYITVRNINTVRKVYSLMSS